MLRDTAGESLILDFVAVSVFYPLRPPDTSPMFCCAKHPVMLRGTAEEEGEMYSPFASASILYTTPRKAAGHGRGGVLKYPFDSGT